MKSVGPAELHMRALKKTGKLHNFAFHTDLGAMRGNDASEVLGKRRCGLAQGGASKGAVRAKIEAVAEMLKMVLFLLALIFDKTFKEDLLRSAEVPEKEAPVMEV